MPPIELAVQIMKVLFHVFNVILNRYLTQWAIDSLLLEIRHIMLIQWLTSAFHQYHAAAIFNFFDDWLHLRRYLVVIIGWQCILTIPLKVSLWTASNEGIWPGFCVGHAHYWSVAIEKLSAHLLFCWRWCYPWVELDRGSWVFWG